jgi:hypothetical protein
VAERVDRWPNAEARARVNEVFQRLTTLEPAGLGAEELTPEELPFLRFEAAAQERFDAWRGDLEQTLRVILAAQWRRSMSKRSCGASTEMGWQPRLDDRLSW